MSEKEKNIAVVLAAGQGKRMNSTVHKQYLLLKDKPVIYYALKAFQDTSFIEEIILVTGKEEEAYCHTEIVEKFHFSKVKKIVEGGRERYHSVANAMKVVDEDCFAKHTPDRETLWQVQTPQVFTIALAKEAYDRLLIKEEELKTKGIRITDDAMVVETLLHHPVKLVEGSYENIKITTPEDLIIADSFLIRKR